jgi:hypothetical protein
MSASYANGADFSSQFARRGRAGNINVGEGLTLQLRKVKFLFHYAVLNADAEDTMAAWKQLLCGRCNTSTT